MGNAIWKKLSVRQGRELAANISTVAVETVPARSLFEDASDVAIAMGLKIYDAMYAALAVRLDMKLITANERLVRSAASNRLFAGYLHAVQAENSAGR